MDPHRARARRTAPAAALPPRLLAVVLAGALAAPAHAQSVTSGAVFGIARSDSGLVLPRVAVTVSQPEAGAVCRVTTNPAGAYRCSELAPGRYDLYAERLGFRPLRVMDVIVSAATGTTVDLTLTGAEPPVSVIDTLFFAQGAARPSLARAAWDRGRELLDLADPFGRVTALGPVASLAWAGYALEGLPDRLGVVGIDGIPRSGAAHPGASRADASGFEAPVVSLSHAEEASAADVEWQGVGGGLLGAITSRAPQAPRLETYGDLTGSSIRSGLILGAPVVRDTAAALAGVDFRRVETTFAAPWRTDSLSGALAGIARDSLATDLSAYLHGVTQRTDALTAFGRFDWAVADGQSVALRAAVSDRTSSDVDLGGDRPLGLGTRLEARDISVSGAFRSHLTTRLRLQFSLGVDRSLRDWRAPALPGTDFVAAGLAVGADGALPGRFERNATRALTALLYRAGPHDFKAGFVGTWSDHDLTYSPWQQGVFLFGSAADFAARRGEFLQAVGGAGAAQFSTRSVAFFLQDTWTPLPGVTVLAGVQSSKDRWPLGGPTLSAEWLRLTGMANAVMPRPGSRLNPRFAFTWSAGPRREWLLHGEAGLYSESVDPSILAEALTRDGAVQYRRGLGALGAWPAAPDSVAAPLTGPVLTLLEPGFVPPRTVRAAASMARDVGGGTSFQVAGRYRHTDYLPRRSDLNLAAASGVTDQFGRVIYGSLQQLGGLLAAAPGSNRRFSGFDLVSGLDPSGYSDYWGVTVSMERMRPEGLSFWASYTYSQTTDNLPGVAGSLPESQLSPFPQGPGQPDWRDGRSDLDVPHQAALGAQLSFGAVKVMGLARVRSGLPFTPGFRDGVDANGDGSWGNDPAFVSDTVSGAAALVAANQCLRGQVGQFARRNSCRAPAVAALDARLVIRLFRVLDAPVEMVVDGLNLVTSGDGVVDRAVFLVDPSRSLARTGDVVTVPLIANPDFGKLLVRRSAGAAARAGLRVNF